MIKKYYLIFLLVPNILLSQIIISPYVVYTDSKNQFANMIVQNESDDAYEIGISFKFGYPISDSLGNISMKYLDNPDSSSLSILNYVKVFPRKFILKPRQRQLIGLTVKPPQNIKEGTYWVRIVTSSTKQSNQPLLDTNNTNLSAQITFVLNQITTLLYRTSNASTGIEITDIKYLINDDKLDIISSLKRLGNSPFFGDMKVTVFDKNNNLILSDTQHLKVYYDLFAKSSFNISELKKGEYKALIQLTHNEKEDIPQSNPIQLIGNNINKTITFTIN